MLLARCAQYLYYSSLLLITFDQAFHSLSAVLATCTWAFLSVLHREVLMDITDVDGDAAAGVLTMPVVLGRPVALLFATACVAVASAYGVALAVGGNGLSWLVGAVEWVLG